MPNPFRFMSDRKAWESAKRTHQLEHASGIDPTLSCDAIGHAWYPPEKAYPGDGGIDSYDDIFMPDLRRKFCIATGRKW